MVLPKRWNINKGAMSINGEPVVGFADEDVITASYADSWHAQHTSSDGFTRTSTNPSRKGTITIRTTQGSVGNTVIEKYIKLDEPMIISYTDFTAVGSFVLGEGCNIDKPGDFVRALEEGNVEWVFMVDSLDFNHGTAVTE